MRQTAIKFNTVQITRGDRKVTEARMLQVMTSRCNPQELITTQAETAGNRNLYLYLYLFLILSSPITSQEQEQARRGMACWPPY